MRTLTQANRMMVAGHRGDCYNYFENTMKAFEAAKQGGNHLAKILAKKCSGKLYEVTERLKKPLFEAEKVEELYAEILSSTKVPKKEGKGYQYPTIGHVVGLEGSIKGDRRKLLAMAGF